MSLTPGTRLGPYEVLSSLGAGGMGEVYRARDTRLGRDVAIKVLPQHLSGTPELRARFEREARSVSQLNHPNICVLHDVGREGDTDFLVMELIEGETLERRLTRGPLPLPELLRIGSEVASALDRAHRSGIVHRDLKPGNIMLTRSGSKLMDFGLARAAAGPVASTTQAGMTQSPTVAQALTGEGKIVGTFQYMSPEQLEGKEADARSDLWALGCVLYEMATGARPFTGAGTASLIASIMKDEPRMLAELAPMSPPALDRVVTRCLAKDPDDRWQSARDLAAELRYIGESAPSTSRTQAASVVEVRKPTLNRERVFWSAALIGVVLAALALQMLQQPGTGAGTSRLVQFNITTPEEINLVRDAAEPSISPDGSKAALCAVDSSGASLLWVRPMDSVDARPLAGTDNATLPFWSPDSRYLAYFADGKLKKIRVEGGPSQILCDANNGRGGSWSKDGTIVFCPAAEGPLYRVSAAGGTPTPVTTLETAAHETGHRWPWFLPDGKHFIYVVLPG
ncbi:MAG TPA: protein kinase, partial [Candidatus Eisenbacteria bacterium]|nr:protein kinase [Candidatus Eisenbacteria bacterium]